MDQTNRDLPDDLYDFAKALVGKLICQYQLKWKEHRREDAVQELFLAGWQVWSNTGDGGLAKNRMASRTSNLLRDFSREDKHEPTYVDRIVVWPSKKRGEMILNAAARPLWKDHGRLHRRSWSNRIAAPFASLNASRWVF